MRRLFLILLLCPAVLCSATGPDAMNVRAARAYESGEWASAQAMYSLVTEREPDDALPYGRAIVAASMRGDTASVCPLLEKGLQAGVPLDSLLGVIENGALALGEGSMYLSTLDRIAATLPYLRRPVDARLLSYFKFRRDAANTALYARRLLAGLPEDARYLNDLAWAEAMQGNFAEAEATWRKVLEYHSDNLEALTALGNMLVETRPDEALVLLGRANELHPSNYLASLISKLKQRTR